MGAIVPSPIESAVSDVEADVAVCGIGGVYDLDDVGVDDAMLCAMNDRQAHRGPDDEGYYRDRRVGLAHRRLSIVGLDTGSQPIYNEDGDVVVVFNGEIYNHTALRTTLEANGHRFTTDTDTEVLVHLYEEHGSDMVTKLRGMFAFALWDATDERLLLARDRIGIKPLHYGMDGNWLVFGSELNALLVDGFDHGGVNRHAIGQYFLLGHVPTPYTAFENVRKLHPGELLIVKDGATTKRQYYAPTPVSIGDTGSSSRPQRDRLRSAVVQSVKRRLMSDVPLGAFLSGGIDSSIVVGVMAQLTDEPVKTYTIGFEDTLFDETWAAAAVAAMHDTNHHVETITPDHVLNVFPEIVSHLGEPFADPSLLPTYVVSNFAAQDVKVVLSGDGADELFVGYDRYRAEYLSSYYRAIPTPLRARLVRPAIRSLPASRTSRLGNALWKLHVFAENADRRRVERHLGWLRNVDDRVAAVAAEDPTGPAVMDLRRLHDDVRERLSNGGEREISDLELSQNVDVLHTLPDQMLTKVDLASMYNSLEVRVPMLDVDVVEFAMGLPMEQKLTGRKQKVLLKEAFEDILPDAVQSRRKQGFDVPVGQWLSDELAGDFETVVDGLDGTVVDGEAVMEIYDEHTRQRRNHDKFLWSAYTYGKWSERMYEEGVLSA